jgi:hypothetical protein
MKPMLLLLIAALLLAFQNSRGAQQPSVPTAVAGYEGKIRALEAATMAAGAEKGADGYMSFYADDAVELPNGANALKGKDAIRKTIEFLNDKTIIWHGRPTILTSLSPAIWHAATGLLNSARWTRTASQRPNTDSTSPFGRSKKVDAGKLFSIWASRVPNQKDCGS